MAAATLSSDPSLQQSADCRKLGSREPEIFTRKQSVQKFLEDVFLLLRTCLFFLQNTSNMFVEKSPTTSQKFLFRLLRSCVWALFPPPLLLCPPASCFFLATFFLEIRLLGDGIHRLVQRFTVQRASNICR